MHHRLPLPLGRLRHRDGRQDPLLDDLWGRGARRSRRNLGSVRDKER